MKDYGIEGENMENKVGNKNMNFFLNSIFVGTPINF